MWLKGFITNIYLKLSVKCILIVLNNFKNMEKYILTRKHSNEEGKFTYYYAKKETPNKRHKVGIFDYVEYALGYIEEFLWISRDDILIYI